MPLGAEKPAFKGLLRKHRMIIPMDGFYEWQQGSEGAALTKAGKPSKQPMFIHRPDGEPLALAALPAAPATAGNFGQHVRTCAQTHGFSADDNPGMHKGITGWDPTHEC